MKLFLIPVWLLVFLSFVMTSCKSDASKNGVATHENEISENTRKLMNWDKQLVSDSLIHNLSQPKLLVRFDDKYPVEMDVIDSLLYVVMVRSDTAVYVYNKHTSELCYSFGLMGGGPKDVEKPHKERTAHILRIDWDGNIAGIYFMDKAITSGFCVEEAAGEMYCISHETEDSDEYYDIVSYKL